MDGFDLELDADEQMDEDCDGFANAEEKTHFERYLQLIEFGQSISRFAMQYCDGPLCAPLRQRMNVCCITWTFTIKSIHFKNAFGLICYADPSQSAHMDLMSQKERDFVAKALNTAILGKYLTL